MKVTVHRDPQPHVEALWAIEALFNGDAPRATVESLSGKYPAHAARIRALFASAVAIQDDLEKIIDKTDPNLRFLFEKLPESENTLSVLFVRGVDVERVDDAAVRRTFTDFFFQLDNEAPFTSGEALLAYIKAQKLPFAVESALLYTYRNYHELYAYIRALAAEAWAVIERHRPSWQGEVDAAVAFCEEHFLPDGGLEKTFHDMGLPIELGGESDVELSPHIFRPSSLTAAQYDERESICMFWGIHMAECWELGRSDELAEGRLQEVLKILADKTKFEILRLLRKESLYGGALAEALGLTPATISYHVSQLTGLGLVRIVKDRGRYYYEVDNAMLAQYLTVLNERLL